MWREIAIRVWGVVAVLMSLFALYVVIPTTEAPQRVNATDAMWFIAGMVISIVLGAFFVSFLVGVIEDHRSRKKVKN